MHLSPTSHSPKYSQIADVIRQRVARGRWSVGQRLPTNDELAAEFGVSRITIRQAVELLSQEKVVEARQGRGTFVTGAPAQNRWLRVETSLMAMADVYRETSPDILTIAEASARPSLRPEDGIPAADYVFMRRLHSRNDQIYCVASIYLARPIFRKHATRFRREVVVPILAEMKNPAVTRARQTLTIGLADLEVSQLLKIPLNSPVAEVRRVFNSSDGTIVYLGEVTYRGDFIHIEMDLKA